jgi:hypothetical protein
VRQLADGSYQHDGNGVYVKHKDFASDARHYLRGFQILQKDLIELFDYVEPATPNLGCYSYRILELHTRFCIEIEAHCRAILAENGYAPQGRTAVNWNMGDYQKIEISHRLSAYTVRLPVWHGLGGDHTPYASWRTGGSLPWYQAYNNTKHSRHENFGLGNFGNLLEAACGLVAILSAQFLGMDFGPSFLDVDDELTDGFEHASGGYFLVKYPDNWPLNERYNFDWQTLKNDPNPFQSFQYP